MLARWLEIRTVRPTLFLQCHLLSVRQRFPRYDLIDTLGGLESPSVFAQTFDLLEKTSQLWEELQEVSGKPFNSKVNFKETYSAGCAESDMYSEATKVFAKMTPLKGIHNCYPTYKCVSECFS
jgi:hypothetical protein